MLAGFTLLEVLIALGLLALVVGLGLGMLRLGARAWGAAAERSAETETFQTTHGVLRRLAERAFPMAWGEPGSFRYAFEGTPKAFRFVALFPGYPGYPGPHWVSFEASPLGADEELRLVLRTFHTDEDETREGEPIEDIVLVPGPLEATFSYWGSPAPGGEAAWWPEWRHENSLPTRVRIALVPRDDDRRAWPDLVVAMPITMDGACLFIDEAPTHLCRLDAGGS
ncbi:MAG: prepilin-type N-terminal cleavage/methylation domain-containing protein [Alphaproteobacteria bacterium]